MTTESKTRLNTCYFCGRTGADVNRFTYTYIGGQGEVRKPICGDALSCIKRVERIRFDCAYCPATFPDFKGIVNHWENLHRFCQPLLRG